MNSRLFFVVAAVVLLLWGCVCACASSALPGAHQLLHNNHRHQQQPENEFLFGPSVSSDSSSTCTSEFTCASEGDACTGAYLQGHCRLTEGSCCAFGLLCFGGRCVVDNAGSPCNATAGCYTWLGAEIQCVNGACQYVYGPGDGCDSVFDCLYGLPCVDGICRGVSVGEPCYPGQCAYGSACLQNNTHSLGECVASLPLGAKCLFTDECITGTICFLGTCTALFSLPAGAACYSNNTMNNLCGPGLTCADNNHTCVATTNDLQSCTSSFDCPNNQSCLCSYYTGNQFCDDPMFSPCAGELEPLVQCQMNNNCTDLYDSPNSCVSKHCQTELVIANTCACNYSQEVYSGCAYNQCLSDIAF